MMRARPEAPPRFEIPYLDLRDITRHPQRVICTIEIQESRHGGWTPWIECGAANVSGGEEGRWRLEAHLPGAVDCDHSTAYAFRLPLIALQLKFVRGGMSTFNAYVDPNDGSEPSGGFNIPPPNYDPRKHKDAFACKSCSDREHHVYIPDGLYVPPFDKALYEKVRGKYIGFMLGPRNK